MNVDGRVVSIVGPNEAGKTSLLHGLLHLNASGDFGSAELSRGQPTHEGPILWARYLLEPEDLDAIRHLPGAKQARWFVASKLVEGELLGRVEPQTITRDLAPRKRTVKALRRAASQRAIQDVVSVEGNAALDEALTELSDALDSDQETLPGIADKLSQVAERLTTELPGDAPKYVRELPARLERLAEHEQALRPHHQAIAILFDRQPEFVLFGNAERSLQSDYDLNTNADEPPVALRNLAKLAKLDLSAVRDAIHAADFGLAEHLEEQANKRLAEVFGEAWRQSGVSPRVRLDGSVLRILVSATSGGYTTFAERSEGLRWFVSLLTYTTLNPSEIPPILLVDEAESHLHYDAQADLVRVFSQQRTVAKIIYTTHSAGCLPQDLGTGVRVVLPTDDGTSSLRNHFWTEGPGFSPLLTAMGANVLAFTPTRFAVIAEGASDVVLLPSIFREVTDDEVLGFQVAPGLAQLTLQAVGELDLEAARVAYIVDGDEAGREIKKKLKRGGVPDALIITLGGTSGKLVLEDTLQGEVYVTAVNQELTRSYGEKKMSFPESALPPKGRPAALEAWCAEQGIAPPRKTAVAYRVLDLHANGTPIVAANRQTALARTYRELREALKLPLETDAD